MAKDKIKKEKKKDKKTTALAVVPPAKKETVSYSNGVKTTTYSSSGKTYKSKSYYSNDFKAPMKDIAEYETNKHFNDFSYRNVVVIEKLKGKSFSVHFDGTNVVFKNDKNVIVPKDSDWLGFKDVFYKEYAKSFVKLTNHLKKVPFTLHGEVIGHTIDPAIEYFKDVNQVDIFFYDIYLNRNWMDWEDFSYLMKAYDIQAVPLFYNGNFPGEETLKKFAEKPNTEGIVVRPIYEETISNKRLIVKVSNSKFRKATVAEMDELKCEARLHMFKEFANVSVLWKAELTAKGIEIEKKNIPEIMKLISKRGVEEIENFMADEFFIENKGKYMLPEIKRVMKTELASLIRVELGINGLKK